MSNDRYLTSKYKSAHGMSNKEKDYWIRQALREKGRAWMIGAMVEGSIGYHTPKHANLIIDRFLAGNKEDYCERCYSLYKCDLIDMMYDDVRLFDWIDIDCSTRIVEAMKQIIQLDSEHQELLSLAYPTMGI